ncbi:MAG TPA: sortase [Candidatus Limnocylindrales bacterium]|nr:sortase [Candidatus Limnocylindrales bacterium]
MNGHAAGQRAGWLLAATVLAFGVSSGVDVQAHGPLSKPASQISSALADSAVADQSVQPIAVQPTTPVLTAEAANSSPSHPGWPRIALDPVTVVAPPSPAPAHVDTTRPAKPAAPKPAKPVWWSVYHGTNHVWMPTLGINKPVYGFSCSRSTDPANYVYRWGCAGTNNVYLLGHAWGVFKALHDAYFNGRLKVGMPVIYADSHGHVHLYRVTTWAVTSPADITWSYSQRVPSMTLQTCLGAQSQWRLNVRLVEVSS